MGPRSCFTFLLAISALVIKCRSFNIDLVHPIVYEDPYRTSSSRSYFGYSVQMLQTRIPFRSDASNWLLVGAPKGSSVYRQHANISESGQLFRCGIGSSNDSCVQALVDSTGNNRTTAAGQSYFDRKDYSWLGGSVAAPSSTSGRVAVCGHRWVNKIFKNYYLLNGACYWSNHDIPMSSDFNKMLPLINRNLQGEQTFYYAYGQAGTSLHMTVNPDTQREEMLLGAPGVYNWTGTVIRVSDGSGINVPPSRRKRQEEDIAAFSSTLVPHPGKTPQFGPLQYFGYSIHSGTFSPSNPKKLYYVGGAPRAANMKGKVFIFDFVGEYMEVLLDKEGSQVGEYFGASVLAMDVNKDGNVDLLVGAPMFCVNPESTNTGDEGKVYVFLNKGNWVFEEKDGLFGGRAVNARFGLSLVNVGDLNNDGYSDVAIGAPYEDGKAGAVYIYHGGMSGISPRYSQRIRAIEFPSLLGFTGFGISISAADMDNNQYPDLAIGSYLSDQAIIFRGKPTVRIHMNLLAKPTKVAPVNGTAQLIACVNFTTKAVEPSEICVAVRIQLDLGFSNPRLLLAADGSARTSTHTYNSTVRSNSNQCRSFSTYVVGTATDYSRPVTVRLSTELLNRDCSPLKTEAPGSKAIIRSPGANQRRDEFCNTCPVTDKREQNYTDLIIPFVSGCGDDDKCEADLHVVAQFIPASAYFVIGSAKSVSLVAMVTNFREPAYLPALEIKLPANVDLQRIPRNCKVASVSIDRGMRYSCSIVSPLHAFQNDTLELELDVTRLRSGSPNLEVEIEATTNSDLSPGPGHFSHIKVVLPLRTEADVTIVGIAGREQQIYHKKNETSEGTQKVIFEHSYEVTKYLASPLNFIEIMIFVPKNAMTSAGPVPLIEFLSVEGKHNGQPLSCKHDFALQMTPAPDKPSDFEETSGSRRRRQTTPSLLNGDTRMETSIPANRTTTFNCSGTNPCSLIVCTAGNIHTDSRVTVSFKGALLVGKLVDLIGNKDIIVYSSHGSVMITDPADAVSSSGSHVNKPDSFVLSTYFIPQGPPPEAVQAWVLGLAIGVGILILVLIIAILIKCGFFKRKRPGQVNSEETDAAGERTEEAPTDDDEPGESRALST